MKALLLAFVGLAIVAAVTMSKPESVTVTTPYTNTAAQPQGRGATLCMPKPSACGFPDPTHTGVRPGTELATTNGVVTLSEPGQVYKNKEVQGSIVVTAPNVTIRNVRVINTNTTTT